MKELKELLNELNLAIIASDTADKEYEKNPESQEAETAFDKAYKHEYSVREKIAHKIVEVTSGAVEVDENNNLQFVSYEHDFMVTASRFSEGTFEDCNLSTFVGNLIAEELKND